MEAQKEQKLNRRYLAGLMDGESYFGILPRNNSFRRYFVPVIKIAMTHPEILRLVVQTLGGHVSVREFNGKPNSKTAWCWELRTWVKVRAGLDYVYPYLIVKRPQAEVLKAFLATETENVGRSRTIPESVLVERARLYTLMRQLNHRGRAPAETKRGRSASTIESMRGVDEAIVRTAEESAELAGNAPAVV